MAPSVSIHGLKAMAPSIHRDSGSRLKRYRTVPSTHAASLLA